MVYESYEHHEMEEYGGLTANETNPHRQHLWSLGNFFSMKHAAMAVVGAVVIGITCYLFGLAQGTNKAVKGSNADSLLFFIGIHRHLQAGQIGEAISLSETAMATHAGVIQTAEDHPAASLVFLYPWMGPFGRTLPGDPWRDACLSRGFRPRGAG